jgi:V/A-type H+-transporting ATPase subunit C
MSIMAGGKGNFAYACTRVKAKKRFLLGRETYSRLLVMDVHEIGRSLGETQYREQMTRYGSRYSGANLVEVAVTRNLGETYSAILSFTTGHLREMVRDYLKRWDMYNEKTILRGKNTKVKDEDIIDTLVPAGAFSEEYLRSFVAMTSVQDIMDAISKEPGLRLTPELIREVVDTGRLASWRSSRLLSLDLLKVVRGPTRRMFC